MQFLFVFILLLIMEIAFFAIARKFNIVDRPNMRSSHSNTVIRGGGILFPLAALGWFMKYQEHGYFIAGLVMVSIISFCDDIRSVSNRLRMAVQFIAAGLVVYDTIPLTGYSYVTMLVLVIVIAGIINLFNFMDGINGITALYNLGWLGSVGAMVLFFHVNMQLELVWIESMALLVFLFFNFREKAACFAGDVGSVSIALICCFILINLIMAAHSLIPILFLAVYIVDGSITILFRLIRKENIFQAHRTHLYQVLANEYSIDHRLIAVIYFIVQLLINIWALYAFSETFFAVHIIFLQVFVFLVSVYLFLRIQLQGWKKLFNL